MSGAHVARACTACGEPSVVAVPGVPEARGGLVYACLMHANCVVSRSRDVGWLARRRAGVTGESVAEAWAALTGTTAPNVTAGLGRVGEGVA